ARIEVLESCHDSAGQDRRRGDHTVAEWTDPAAGQCGKSTRPELRGADPASPRDGHVEATGHHAREDDRVVPDPRPRVTPLDAERAGRVRQGLALEGRPPGEVPAQRPVVLDVAAEVRMAGVAGECRV